MTVLLVVFTAVLFLTVDYFYNRRNVVQLAGVPQSRPAVAPLVRHNIIDGFEVPPHLRYHPGHTWALSESPNLVRAGLDQLGAALLGKLDRVDLPRRGQWVRQGQKVWTVYKDGHKVEISSPIEGVVTDINDAVIRDPDLARRDPYGEGWLMMVQSPDAKTNFRNLLSGGVVRPWVQEAAARLRNTLPAMAGAVAQDGGLVVDDLSAQLPDPVWEELTRAFFLS